MYVPVTQKLIFFRKISCSKKAVCVNVGLAESNFTGQIYFHWPNLFSLVEYISWHICCTSQRHKNFFFPKNPSLKKALYVNVGLTESIFIGQICFYWPNLFSLVKPILWHILFISQRRKTRKIPRSKNALYIIVRLPTLCLPYLLVNVLV